MFAAAHAQLRKIPSEVTELMTEKYPDAAQVEWKDKLVNFEASFEMKGETFKAVFNNKGEWVQTEKNISEDALPDDVLDGLEKSKYSDLKILETSRIEKNDGKIQYRILSKKNDIQKKYLYFNANGKLVKELITL